MLPLPPRRPARAPTASAMWLADDPVSTTVSRPNRLSVSRSHLMRCGQPSRTEVTSSMNQKRRPSGVVNRPPASTSDWSAETFKTGHCGKWDAWDEASSFRWPPERSP